MVPDSKAQAAVNRVKRNCRMRESVNYSLHKGLISRIYTEFNAATTK